MKNFIAHTIKFSKENNLFPIGSKVLLGCSGGQDSNALLLVLHRAQKKLSISELVACYVNHGQQNVSEHLKSIETLCNTLKIKLKIVKLSLATCPKGSSEDTLRNARREALTATANRIGANVIALGHTQDDQAETVLMRIIRGTGVCGLSGISPKVETVVRPILWCKRGDILHFLNSNKIEWCEDQTNYDVRYLRNMLRQVLLPFIEKNIQPGFKDALIRLSEDAHDYNEGIGDIGETLFNHYVSYLPTRGLIINGIARVEKIYFRKYLVKACLKFFKTTLTATQMSEAIKVWDGEDNTNITINRISFINIRGSLYIRNKNTCL